MKHYDGLALFSGGLDSLLAARLLMEQGRSILCLHFFSPFFGIPRKIPHWSEVYGLEILPVDVSEEYAALLCRGPKYGFGSAMNPCVDCKILMMRRAKSLLEEFGARFLVSGEVLGQRPMSQRRDTLNIIRRDAGVKDLLLRPLCARLLDPVEAETSGLVDRSRLLAMNGRGRKEQLALAARLGIKEIPTPGGGCRLTEKENTRRYWPVMRRLPAPLASDFRLANLGRQFWKGGYWLSMGRTNFDNEGYAALLQKGDLLFKLADFPGPLAVGRGAAPWDADSTREAAALVASYSSKACQAARENGHVRVRVTRDGEAQILEVAPQRETPFHEPSWEEASEDLRALHRQNAGRPL